VRRIFHYTGTNYALDRNNVVLSNIGDVTVNVAWNRPARQISTYATAVASRAVDGRIDGESCTQYSNTPWWSVDIGTAMYVYRVQVTNSANTNFRKSQPT